MKKIIFIGYVVSPDEANVASGASVAGNKMQWNVIKNLRNIEDINISCVTVTPLASYPNDEKIYQREEEQNLFQNVKVKRISYLNLPVIKQLWQIINVYRAAKKIVIREKVDMIFCFNLFPQIGIPMRWLKRKFPYLNTVCLLADLPIDDNTERTGLSLWLRNIVEKSTWKSMEICNKYIVLNKHVIEKYLPNKSYIVVDGGVAEEDIEKYNNTIIKNKEHNVVYSGALTEYNGVKTLIKAMNELKMTDIYLDIYGSGYLEEEVRQAERDNPHIRYHGRVSNAEVMKKQQEAWLLVNPRIVNDPIAQVTFPSKTFEYLLSGTPVLSTRLNGYSDEYKEVMIFCGDSALEISKAIGEIRNINDEVLNDMAQNAKKFIINQRNWEIQTKKIYNFIKK
ncbi:glycosyltransferase [Thomasclavelia spiroformis]|uniref:glycosyltransferase n=1 Tax=Thomasclavelia spiroformis TaxID=29348 RepID=UPI00255BE01B|nr:glycosyltransferase [Thomasclavelia spiroformis]